MKKAQVFIVFAVFLLIVFGFQNCSAPLPEEGTQTGSSSSTSKINFAFNTEVDQVAYMSCHQLGTNFDRSSYFTFRVGAYNAGSGVGMTSQALQDLASAPREKWKSEIIGSAVNLGAQPILSVREPNNAQTLFLPGASGGPTQGYDHAKMVGVLSEDFLIDELLKNTNQRIRYKRNGSPEGARLEGDLNLNFGISGLNSLQNYMNNGSLLAINFPVRANSVVGIRAPAQYFSNLPANSSATQVYGKGLRLQFRRHPANTSGTGPAWAVGSVGEENMELALTNASRFAANKLACPNDLVFKIVDRRHLTANAGNTDSTKIYCETKPDDLASMSAADRESFRRARLSLRVEDWFIDWTRKCIVPKKFDSGQNQCYGASSSTVPVEYDLAKPCVESPTVNTVRACVGLASICIR